MKYDDLFEKINLLDYHQKLLLNMVKDTQLTFFKLVIEKSLNERDVDEFFTLCDKLYIELKEQKAEGFVHLYSLFDQFKNSLHPNLHAEEVIQACRNQRLFVPLMEELLKCISD